MNKIGTVLLAVVLAAGAILAEDRMLPAHREWLDLVDPIITKTERQVFFQLSTDEERTKFIHLFWKRRDSLPDTSVNEFQSSYMERVRFADRYFGHAAPGPGHLTERGRFYLILGPPLERQIYATQSDVYPLELWHYKGEQKYGLPPFFYLIFFQDKGIGEYRLYSPDVDGPARLLTPGVSSATLGRSQAYKLVKNVSSELAGAALSYIPGESSLGVTSFSSASIVAGIQDMAEKKFNDAYARQFLYYKDFVETEYSHSYIESRSRVKLFRQAGLSYLHWSLEPSKVNFAEREGRNTAVYQLVLRVEDTDGGRVLEKEDEIPLTLDPETTARRAGGLLAVQDILPVIPGRYRLFFLLRNKTGQEFSSFDREFFVAEPGPEPVISNLLVYQGRSQTGASTGDRLRAFTFNGVQYLCNAENNCNPDSDVGVYFRIHGLKGTAGAVCRLRILRSEDGETVREINKPLAEGMQTDGIGVDLYPVSLTGLKAGYYRVNAALEDASGSVILEESENIVLLARALPTLPWALSRLHTPPPNPEHLALIGAQYFAVGRMEPAEKALRQALELLDKPHTRQLLARVLFEEGRHQECLELVQPVYDSLGDRSAAKLTAAAMVEMEREAEALKILNRLLETSAETSVLNLAAQCHIRLDRPEDALPLLEKSLRLQPDQAKIKDLVERIRKK